jgi:hypothetical protein
MAVIITAVVTMVIETIDIETQVKSMEEATLEQKDRIQVNIQYIKMNTHTTNLRKDMKKGDEYLAPEQRKWSIATVQEKMEKIENDESIPRDLKAIKLKELRLVKKIKLIQDRMELEDKVREVLKQDRVGGNYQPDQVAKVIGTTERQAVVIERKALAKLKSPKLGRKIRGAMYG